MMGYWNSYENHTVGFSEIRPFKIRVGQVRSKPIIIFTTFAAGFTSTSRSDWAPDK